MENAAHFDQEEIKHAFSHVVSIEGQTASSRIAETSPQRLISLSVVQQASMTPRRRRRNVSAVAKIIFVRAVAEMSPSVASTSRRQIISATTETSALEKVSKNNEHV